MSVLRSGAAPVEPPARRRRVDAKWRTVREFGLPYRKWGEEYVLYHSGSGDTHLLDQIGVTALELLRRHELTPIQLCRRIAEELGFEMDKALLNRIRKILEQYQVVGLVESVRG